MPAQDVLQQLQGAVATATNPNAALDQAQQQTGATAAAAQVSGLRGAINNTTTLLSSIAPKVMGGTANSLMTSAGANRVIQNQSAPVQATLSGNARDIGDADLKYGAAQGQATAQAKAKIAGEQGNMSYLENLYNSLYASDKANQDRALQKHQNDIDNQIMAEQAAKARQSSGGGGGGGGRGRSSGGSSGGGGGRPTIQQVIDYYMGADSSYGAYNAHGTNNHRWQAAADELKSMGFNTQHGSQADRLLQAAFNRQGK